jgi:sulfate adenylyltransferase large subunit
MITGASNCDLMIVIVDARHGVLTQTKRHTFLASLLQVPHLVVAVNKMDLVGYSRVVYEDIVNEFSEFAAKLAVHDLTFIPISALKGDNVVTTSGKMPWYEHASLLRHLEDVHVASDRNLIDLRFPVQHVLRPHQDFRGYAGTLASGVIRVGDEVMALPSGKSSRVRSLVTYDGELSYAFAGQSVTLTLEDEIDVGRGDMLIRPNNVPDVNNVFEAILCWMDAANLQPSKKYYVKHTTLLTRCMVEQLRYRIDVNTLHREPAAYLTINEIGRARIKTLKPLFLDPYPMNRATGCFIMIDPMTHDTVAGGMVLRPEKVLDFERIHEMETKAAREFGED